MFVYAPNVYVVYNIHKSSNCPLNCRTLLWYDARIHELFSLIYEIRTFNSL